MSHLTPIQRFQTRLIAAAAYPTIAALCGTLRWQVEGAERYDEIIRSGHQPIIGFWHGRILPAAWYFRRRGIVAMTSANFDGQWTARLLEHFGNRTVAGSTSRRGMRAMLEIRRALQGGHPAAFALDGPRGPARIAQPGAAWLAAVTGNPILPFHAEAGRHWTLSSWDRTQIPKPGSRVVALLGEPITIPAGSDDSSAAAARKKVEAALLELEDRALRLLREG
jgi:lysophospholipid acyltransferase (LPLAT)-like uncharacterized protein